MNKSSNLNKQEFDFKLIITTKLTDLVRNRNFFKIFLNFECKLEARMSRRILPVQLP